MGKGRVPKVLAFLFAMAGTTPLLACVKADTRFAATSNTLYIETPVTCTPTLLAAFLKKEVLELVDPANKVWLLKANLRITAGGTLRLYGPTIGGDTGEFRLLSSNSPVNYIRINPRWGTLDIRSTRVTSWDPSSNGPDATTANGRAYIHAESFLDGSVPRESRMDIADSEVHHLGFYDAVSYGLVWKVIGDPAVTPYLYDQLQVYGSVVRSYIHHNYMGFYSFGGESIQITDNHVAYNESYGIDPHDDSDRLVISRNLVHDNGAHGIICSRRCNNLTITDNEVYNSDHGIMLHREVIDTLVANNYVHENRDNGIAVFESHYNTIRNNIVEDNDEGIRLSLGSHDNLVQDNVVRGSEDNGLYLYQGTDPPETTDGRPRNNTFRGNTLVGNTRIIKARNSDNILFTANVFNGSSADIEIYDSSAIDIVGNTDQLLTLDVTSDGSVSGSSYVRVEADRNVKAKIDAAGAGVIDLTNPAGRLLDPEELAGDMLISGSGSRTTLTGAMIGSTSNVAALPIWATTSGSFSVRSPVASAASTTWTVEAASPQSATFTVAQLTPAALYRIYRDGVQLMSLSSGSGGQVQFSDSFGSGVHTFAVTR